MLCLSPTYELAIQTGEVAARMASYDPDIKIRFAVRGEEGNSFFLTTIFLFTLQVDFVVLSLMSRTQAEKKVRFTFVLSLPCYWKF